jgi:hypothetical protein
MTFDRLKGLLPQLEPLPVLQPAVDEGPAG